MSETSVRIPETAFAVAPDYFGSVFREGKWTRYYLDEKGKPIIPVLDVSEPAHRNRWALENMRVFSDGTVVSPAERWKRSIGPSIIDDWLSELKFAASRVRFDIDFSPDLPPEEIEKKKKEMREDKKKLREGIKKTELDIKAMMAVSASARAMEISAGSAEAYVQVITGGDKNLDKQDFWGEFLLHNDPCKLIRVIENPLVNHYYKQLIQDAGININVPLHKEEDEWVEDWNIPGVLEGKLVEFLEKKGGLDEYISELVIEEESKPEFPEFIEECKKLLIVDEKEEEIDDGVRWAAAKLAADAFLVHMFTQWEYVLDQKRLAEQKAHNARPENKDDQKKENGIRLNPFPGWGGNPLRAVLEPSFLTGRIKKMYKKEDQAILNMTNLAFRPTEDIFKEELEKKALKASMTVHLKHYARYSDALWTFLGSSRGSAIPQWSRDTVEKDLPRIAEMLDQVYGDIDEPEQNTGKQIVGAMMARIIECKTLATAVESARPGFRQKMRILFDPTSETTRPFYEIEKAIWGPDLDAKRGLLASFAGGRTRLVFRDNIYGAEKRLRNAWEILVTNDQDPKGRGRAKTLNTIGFVLDVLKAFSPGSNR